ncbi:50S ribosomal protein L29 [Desulfohalovibrio reitneri]|jgi:large subunit ribosomal protein L29|uniref:50S ribosomal protein L29 n=1 Tax=Desulfohalovibrio reitneri TaxID=1307759 RepID=UPI0004A6BD73|nr:50S ribosomal protein L29 [Desulfohalovibrio reitneri]
MDTKAVRDLDEKALAGKLGEYRQELFNLRFQHATAQLENTQRLKAVRKNIARILTVMNERKRG